MTVHILNPLTDPRWPTFVESQPRASIFHTRDWLEAVRRTYGYEPVVYTTSPPATSLTNGVVLCDVRSWLTGRRLVSVPFADHCDPLVEKPEDRDAVFGVLRASVENGTWKYVEIRPRSSDVSTPRSFRECNSYCVHTLDLRPPVEELFRRLHKDSNQRKIRRAEREALSYEEGRSEALIDEFYRLHLLTRRRHQLPPQPIDWFRNLIACLGDKLTICMASKNGRSLGCIITLRYNDTLVYKYGASDASFHNLGTMPLLFWKVIQAAKEAKILELDLGRSNPQDGGLILFKDRLGAARSMSTYLKYSVRNHTTGKESHVINGARRVFAKMPDRLLIAAGKLLYKHIG